MDDQATSVAQSQTALAKERTRLAKELPKKLRKLSFPVAPSIGQRVEVTAAGSEGRAVQPKSQAGLEVARLARFVVRNLRQT